MDPITALIESTLAQAQTIEAGFGQIPLARWLRQHAMALRSLERTPKYAPHMASLPNDIGDVTDDVRKYVYAALKWHIAAKADANFDTSYTAMSKVYRDFTPDERACALRLICAMDLDLGGAHREHQRQAEDAERKAEAAKPFALGPEPSPRVQTIDELREVGRKHFAEGKPVDWGDRNLRYKNDGDAWKAGRLAARDEAETAKRVRAEWRLKGRAAHDGDLPRDVVGLLDDDREQWLIGWDEGEAAYLVEAYQAGARVVHADRLVVEDLRAKG